GRFLLCDARRLFECPQLQPKEFDVVIFMLSIQDMEPLQAVIQSANRVLKPRGCFILVMVHPCFRVPRQSGWGWDSRRKIQYRRVDRYLTPLAVPMQPYSGGTTRSFHRPLSEYVNCLAESGLVVNCMKEIPTYEVVTAGKHTRAENRAHQQIPLFLSLRAMKVGDISESELSS
ncbi:MAG: class I SAM-dependent methyltransferase, partial [Candidatus Poribacteria bacterium]|nr:class I SAM-dependent methyltransferase [Candidatus Poribacteria bacterium]